jgi:hypothetical protein
MTMNEAVMKYLVAMKGLQVAVVFARSGSKSLLGSGNTVWDHDGEYFDKVVIAETYGSVWLGVLTFCSVQFQ